MTPGRYLYVDQSLDRAGVLDAPALDACSERHKIELAVPPLRDTPDLVAEMDRAGCTGVVFEMNDGCPGRIYLRHAGQMLRRGFRPFFHWPRESAVELIDRERAGATGGCGR